MTATETGSRDALGVALHKLAAQVRGLRFDVPDAAQAERRARRDRVIRTLDDYLLPRMQDLGGPMVAVVLGPTGAGKSSLVNGLAGRRVTRPGAVRPTTRSPVVWCHEDHAARHRAGLLTGYGTEERPLEIVADVDVMLRGLTIVDTPDIDSVELVHHEIARDLLGVADLVIFTTSAQRYADAVPWDVLREVVRRGTPLLFVLNRVREGGDEVVADLRALFDRNGISLDAEGVALFTIAEQEVTDDHGGLPAAAVAPLRARLTELSDPVERAAAIRTAISGALSATIDDSERLADELSAEQSTVQDLIRTAQQAYAAQVAELSASLRDGTLIRDEVLGRWQEFVGTGAILQALSSGVGTMRRWIGRTMGFGGGREEAVTAQARDFLSNEILRRTQMAASTVRSTWELTEPGRALLGAAAGAGYRDDPETERRARSAVADWTAQLARLVEDEGGGRRRIAQVASLGVNVVAVSALVAVFANTGGLTGSEVGVTAGAAAAQQSLLEHVLGGAAARSLVQQARQTLETSLEAVLRADSDRYQAAAESLVDDAKVVQQLRDAVREVQRLAVAADLLDRKGHR